MKNVDEARERGEGDVGQSTKFFTFLQPLANAFNLFRDSHEGLFAGDCLAVSLFFPMVEGVVFKDMLKVLVKADLEQRLFEEGALDRLVELEVEVFPDDISQLQRGVRVEILLLFNHEIQT